MQETKLCGSASREKHASPSANMSIFLILHSKLLNNPIIKVETANPQIYAHRSRIIIAHYSAIELISGQANSNNRTQRPNCECGACL